MDICNDSEWGWDSLTWRVRPGETVGNTFGFINSPSFRLGKRLDTHAVRLLFQKSALALDGRDSKAPGVYGWDSVTITTRPTAFHTINVDDALMWFRVKLVPRWPEPPPKPHPTTVLRGNVVDDSTGNPIGLSACVVVVATRLAAYTDRLGTFNIADVPVGRIGVDACAFAYIGGHLDTQVPRDPITIRLRRDSRLPRMPRVTDDHLPRFGEHVFVEEPPIALLKVRPEYPDDVSRSGVSDTVVVQVLVGADGLVKDTRIEKSIPLLDRTAEECIRKWVFKPALAKSQPVAVWVAVPLVFGR